MNSKLELIGTVAPLMGSVGRNPPRILEAASFSFVAPLTGSVGRNKESADTVMEYADVAPLTGSVGRNWMIAVVLVARLCRSPHGERG